MHAYMVLRIYCVCVFVFAYAFAIHIPRSYKTPNVSFCRSENKRRSQHVITKPWAQECTYQIILRNTLECSWQPPNGWLNMNVTTFNPQWFYKCTTKVWQCWINFHLLDINVWGLSKEALPPRRPITTQTSCGPGEDIGYHDSKIYMYVRFIMLIMYDHSWLLRTVLDNQRLIVISTIIQYHIW